MDAEWEGEASRGALRPPASPAEAVLAPWLAVGHARLEAMLSGRAVQVLDTARQDFVALLAQRLTGACVGVLAFEQQVLEAASRLTGAAPRLDDSVAAWRRRFGQYPALKQVMTRVLLDWQRHVGELLTRLEADRALLGETFFAGLPLPALTGLDADTGDVHDGGRSVAVLRFEHGQRLVYKPKDLRITRATLELFAFLNTAGLPLSLHVRKILVRDGYTWEEFVAAAPCRTADEAARFFQRMGMLLRLFQLLEARDLFLDNLVAAGEHPVFIDLEAMLQPLRPAASPTRAEALLRDSVVHLGILALNALIAPGLPAEDFGALTPPRPLTCPLPGLPAHAALEGRPRSVSKGFQVWIPSQLHSPHLGTEPVLASEHVEDLLAGYRMMQDVLSATRERLLAPDGPLRRLAGLPVRYIHQDTWSYMHTLQASLEPAHLVHPERRREVLASVLELDAQYPTVARAELEALTRLDIPYFLCLSDGNALLDSDGRVLCEGFFIGTALQRMEQRVRDVDDFPMALHEALVRSTLASGHHTAPRRDVETVADDAPRTVDWLAEATRLGDFLLNVALQEEHGPVWLGLNLDPFHGCEQVDVLGPDILSGSTGLALVLADLYRETGQERFRAAALGALNGTLEALRSVPAQVERGDTHFVETGAFRGVGAWLHALSRCALVLDAPALAQTARAHAEARPLELLRERSTADVGLGLTGLLMGLVSCDAGPTARALMEMMERAGTSALTTPPPFPAGSRALRWLPSLDAGLTWCTNRLASCLGLSPRWALRSLAEPSHPADLLVQLDLTGAAAPSHAAMRAHALHLLEAAPSERSTSTEELLDLLEVALVAAEVLGEAPFQEHSQRLGRTLLARFLRHGRWFPDSLAADRHQLSALWGLPAIAHAFLRLHAPGRTTSIRLLRGGALPRPRA